MKTKNPAQPTQYQVTLNFSVLRDDLDRDELETLVGRFGDELRKLTSSDDCTHEVRSLDPTRFSARLCEFIAGLDLAEWDPDAIGFLKDAAQGWDEAEDDEKLRDRFFDSMSDRIVGLEDYDEDEEFPDFHSDLNELRDMLVEYLQKP